MSATKELLELVSAMLDLEEDSEFVGQYANIALELMKFIPQIEAIMFIDEIRLLALSERPYDKPDLRDLPDIPF